MHSVIQFGCTKEEESISKFQFDMMTQFNFSTVVFVFHIFVPFALGSHSISVRMPHVRPDQPESYFCYVHHLEKEDHSKKFVVGFEPKASQKVVHHMLLYGCATPGQPSGYWDCGGMSHGHGHQNQDKIPSGWVCGSEQHILYAWARDAPKLDLPDGVAFAIGGDSGIKHIVLQIHYADISSFQDGSSDNSGVILHYTETQQPKTAGVMILMSGGQIPPHGIEHMDVLCDMNDEDIEIHPFRFRTHTHNLGKFVSGYRIRRDENDIDQWTRIGKRNPLEPQMFYPVENNITIRKGDGLAARCTMVSDRDTPTRMGATNMDEMCNFYIMYWTADKGRLKQSSCYSPGPPNFYWNTLSSDVLNNFPTYADTDEPTNDWRDVSM